MYVDPGGGLFLLQAVISGIVGTAYIARNKVRMWLRRLVRRDRNEEDEG